jgi:membrane-associated progesterone receptor component
LAPFKGAGGGPIYVAVDGIVFNMASHESGPSFYGPGQAYSIFAGLDATIGLATMNTKPSEWAATPLAAITSDQRTALDSWTTKFLEKYAVVGSLVNGANPTTLEQLRARLPARS